MTDQGDFDPARAVQGARQQRAAEEAARQRAKAEQDARRANMLKLFRYAEEQLESIRNPVVSEFVVTEKWRTQESEQFSDKRRPETFRKTLRADQTMTNWTEVGLFRSRFKYTVATKHERETHYYGSWLALHCFSGFPNMRIGLVKLWQPCAGYAWESVGGWDPRNVGYFSVNKGLQIVASLEEAIVEEAIKGINLQGFSIEELTKYVQQALDFVATGQPPEPKWSKPIPDWPGG